MDEEMAQRCDADWDRISKDLPPMTYRNSCALEDLIQEILRRDEAA